ncbi:TPA: hypothetical protein N2C61_003528 [Pseudomonas aeruginosa]|nr:hypothetical protein [Pseudomonas aeruginosa]
MSINTGAAVSAFAIQPLQPHTDPNGNLPSAVDDWCDEDDDIWLIGDIEEPMPLIAPLLKTAFKACIRPDDRRLLPTLLIEQATQE